MKRVPKRRNIIVVLWLAGSAGRKQLTGILRYVNDGHPWSVHLVTEPREFTDSVVRRAIADGIDGFLVHTDAISADALAVSTIPTVLMDFPTPALRKRTQSIAVILDSDEEIGRIGAEYFLDLGIFASYAFIPDELNRGWSRLRERGFKETLGKRNRKCEIYGAQKGSLSDWLKKLPKPVAVMTAYDLLAQKTIETCKQANLAIPKQVAILGVDNDEIICDYSTPSLSSVRIDHEALGFEAARVLDRLMSRQKNTGLRKIFMSADKVIERESTAPTTPSVHLVQKALDYINDHAADGIAVSDVVRHLGVSRRLADRRFGAVTGSSLHRAIEDRRLALVKQKLKDSNLSIAKISRLCGYANVQRLKYVFKARTGMSMSEWRKNRFSISATSSETVQERRKPSPPAREARLPKAHR